MGIAVAGSSPSGPTLPLLLVLLSCWSTVQGITTFATAEIQEAEVLDMKPGCYFSAEYQGEFLMQVSSIGRVTSEAIKENIEPRVQYSTLNITFNAIPVWGYCFKKVDDKVLLRDMRGGYGECIRCVQLVRRSRNIIEIFSKGLNSCYTNETVATESCSQLNSTAILYRTNDLGGEPIRNEYCPFAGKYRFKYTINDAYNIKENDDSEFKDDCSSFSSELDNCPIGSEMHLQFRRCSFQDYDFSFKCLGSWALSNSKAGSGAPRFVAFLDSRGAANFSGPLTQRRPLYRCGLYHVDRITSRTYLALSSDSNCEESLYNSTYGFETFVLSKTTNQKKMPDYVINNSATFPQWAQGEWDETVIVNGTMTFNDLNGYKSFTFVTVHSNDETGRYVVFSKDQCEQEAYICVIMKQRSENVMEFSTGTVSSPVYRSFLCNDSSVSLDRSSASWWTLARLERTVESPCPITGQYTGQITDLPGMCAELSSNCHTRNIMYYKVYDCSTEELYEERTYMCLGQWEENGVTYTYTMRNDTGTNECFVGTIVSDEEIYIKEAGDYCIGNIDPKLEGMRLYNNGQCLENSSSPATIVPIKTSTPVPVTKTTQFTRAVTARVSTTSRPRGVVKESTTQKIPPRFKSSSVSLYESRALTINLAFALSIICIIHQYNLRNLRFLA